MKNTLFAALLLLLTTAFAQTTWKYTLDWDKPHTRTFRLSLNVTATDSVTQFALPVWRPGRYIIQDYAAAVTDFAAIDPATGKKLAWRKYDAYTWTVKQAPGQKIQINYGFYGDNPDAGSSFLGEGQASVNGSNLFMYVYSPDATKRQQLLETPCELEVKQLPETWQVATALPKGDSRSRFKAASYHELADCPIVMADNIHTLSFKIDSTTFFLDFQGNYQGDALTDSTVVQQVRKICSTTAAIFGGKFPFKEYHFLYRLLPSDLRHAVEHSTSAMFVMPDRISRNAKSIGSLYGITAHEFWHAWNVKRIRPAAMWPYDYSRPPYTTLQWFTEGVTDYYTSLILVRAGIYTPADFSRQIGGILYSVDNSYAGISVSPSEASIDSWLATSPYLYQQKNISYYTNGSKAGLILDLSIRKETNSQKSLDDVYRYLYQHYAATGLGVPENGVQQAVEAVTGKSWQTYFDAYIHQAGSPDYEPLFEEVGFKFQAKPDRSGMRGLGILRYEVLDRGGLLVQSVHPNGDAWRDGIGEDDVIVEINGTPVPSNFDADLWAKKLKKGEEVTLMIFRDARTKTVTLTNKGAWAPTTYTIEPTDKGGETGQNRMNWIGQ